MLCLGIVHLTDPIDVPQVERLRKQQQAERDNQEVIQTQRMDSLKSHYESCIQGEENNVIAMVYRWVQRKSADLVT